MMIDWGPGGAGTIHCDLLVIGSGLAGMTAAARAASLGLNTVMAGNGSSLIFSSGLMDFLGKYPVESGTVLSLPGQGLPGLEHDLPGHAYALAGQKKILESFNFVQRVLAGSDLPYVIDSDNNFSVITAMGTVKPSFMVPKTMKAGCAALEKGAKEKLLVIGIKGLQGFSAPLVAAGLEKKFSEIRSVQVELPGINTVVPPQVMARKMEEPEVQNAFIRQVRPFLGQTRLAGIPAVCGIQDSHGLLADLEEKMGVSLFEIPCMPPSIPGLRLKNSFEKALVRSKVRLLGNTRIKSPVFDGKGFILTADFDPHPVKIRTSGVILATGRFFGNGLCARRERIVETVFHLDVAQPVRRSLWHNPNFLAPQGHSINRAGVETDDRFRPLDERGRPVFPNLYAAGGILAHNDWARLKSGAGVSLVSACTAVDAFFETWKGGGNG